MKTPLSLATLWRYGFLALPLAFAGMPLYLHAPDFYATHYGVSLTALGLTLLGLRLFDAVQDPLIGIFSDRLAPHRLALMRGGMLALGIGFLLLFLPPLLSPLLWFAVTMLLATTAFSLLTINLAALGAVWPQAMSAQQPRITTTREAFGLVGLLLGALLPPVLMQSLAAVDAFQLFACIMLALLAVGGVLFGRWYRAHFPEGETIPQAAPFRLPELLRGSGGFYAIYAISMLASSLPAVLVILFIRDRLDAESLTGIFLALYFLAGIFGMPLWRRLAAAYSAERAWLISMVLAIFSFVWAYFLGSGDVIAYGVICVVSGLALGGELALPPAILARRVERSASQSQAAAQFSLLAFLAKLGLALAAGLALPLLEFSGYHPTGDNTESALQAVSLAYALAPCLLKLIAATLLLSHLIQHQGESHHEKTTDRSLPYGHIDPS